MSYDIKLLGFSFKSNWVGWFYLIMLVGLILQVAWVIGFYIVTQITAKWLGLSMIYAFCLVWVLYSTFAQESS